MAAVVSVVKPTGQDRQACVGLAALPLRAKAPAAQGWQLAPPKPARQAAEGEQRRCSCQAAGKVLELVLWACQAVSSLEE